MILHLRMELSNLQLSSQRNIQTNPQQFDLCQKCFILMVSIDSNCLIKKYFAGFSQNYQGVFTNTIICFSLCRWQYMFRYITKQMESHLRCFSYFNFYTSKLSMSLMYLFEIIQNLMKSFKERDPKDQIKCVTIQVIVYKKVQKIKQQLRFKSVFKQAYIFCFK